MEWKGKTGFLSPWLATVMPALMRQAFVPLAQLRSHDQAGKCHWPPKSVPSLAVGNSPAPEVRVDQMTGAPMSSGSAIESRAHSVTPTSTTQSVWPVTFSAPKVSLFISSHEKDQDFTLSRGFKWLFQSNSSGVSLQNDDISALLGSSAKLVFYLAPTPILASSGEGKNP